MAVKMRALLASSLLFSLALANGCYNPNGSGITGFKDGQSSNAIWVPCKYVAISKGPPILLRAPALFSRGCFTKSLATIDII